MYLVDTNVISELRKNAARRSAEVTQWVHSVHLADLYLSAISIYEINIGIRRIERRDVTQGQMLRKWLQQGVLVQFRGKILPFDAAVAIRAADLHVPNQRPLADSFIAATAMEHDMAVVTRDTGDFAKMGVELINPFEYAG